MGLGKNGNNAEPNKVQEQIKNDENSSWYTVAHPARWAIIKQNALLSIPTHVFAINVCHPRGSDSIIDGT